ncbi:ribonucleotide-diphosphate reductase subunit beta [Vibrio phage Va2]|nr:ribonucleotide-diphosphate reductase subunit beta [Vibrio phage Va2]
MSYTTFNRNKNNQLLEPMFLGQGVNVSRYDQQKYPIFDKLIEKQLSFFWRPEEVDVSSDRAQYAKLPDHEKHIFNSNLQYQILLDSIQGRSPNMALLPIVSIPELETWIETWSFSETIHSRSYTHIIRNIVNDPDVIFDSIVENVEIGARAADITKYYDDLIEYTQWFQLLGEGTHEVNGKKVVINRRDLMKKAYLCLMSVNILEAIRFYVSFACSFAFAERELMEGNAKIIKLIARDEALHLSGTIQMIKILQEHREGLDWSMIAMECEEECVKMFLEASKQEKDWASYLFKDGAMLGLNKEMICKYVDYLTYKQMKAVGLTPPEYLTKQPNPLPWMNAWLRSDNVQVAPQEAEISSYLVGQVNNDLEKGSFSEFEL